MDRGEFCRQSRVLVVAGKGGVGKTTVTAALARMAADAGLDVLVVGLDDAGALPVLFGADVTFGYDEVLLYSAAGGEGGGSRAGAAAGPGAAGAGPNAADAADAAGADEAFGAAAADQSPRPAGASSAAGDPGAVAAAGADPGAAAATGDSGAVAAAGGRGGASAAGDPGANGADGPGTASAAGVPDANDAGEASSAGGPGAGGAADAGAAGGPGAAVVPSDPGGPDVAGNAGRVQGRVITPDDALLEYLMDHGLRRVAKRLVSTGVLDVVSTAIPGIREILVLGKVKQLERAGTPDLLLLDAPATGHAVRFLTSANGLMDAARGGPLRTQAADVVEMMHDPDRLQVLLVTLPEETPVNELVETAFRLEDEVGVTLGPVVVNACYPPVAGVGIGWIADPLVLAVAAGEPPMDGSEAGALRGAAGFRASREAVQLEQIDRLSADMPLPQLRLPYVFSEDIGPEEVAELAEALGRAIDELDADELTATTAAPADLPVAGDVAPDAASSPAGNAGADSAGSPAGDADSDNAVALAIGGDADNAVSLGGDGGSDEAVSLASDGGAHSAGSPGGDGSSDSAVSVAGDAGADNAVSRAGDTDSDNAVTS